MLKPPEPMFLSYLSVRLRDIAEKQVPAKLKPTVVTTAMPSQPSQPVVHLLLS